MVTGKIPYELDLQKKSDLYVEKYGTVAHDALSQYRKV
jgi:hypothetical protein